jgi:hypothetical protein
LPGPLCRARPGRHRRALRAGRRASRALDGRGLAAAARRGTGHGGNRERARPTAARVRGRGRELWRLGLPLWPATTAGSAGAPHPGTRPATVRPPVTRGTARCGFPRVTSAPTGDRARPGRERPAAPPVRRTRAGQAPPPGTGTPRRQPNSDFSNVKSPRPSAALKRSWIVRYAIATNSIHDLQMALPQPGNFRDISCGKVRPCQATRGIARTGTTTRSSAGCASSMRDLRRGTRVRAGKGERKGQGRKATSGTGTCHNTTGT